MTVLIFMVFVIIVVCRHKIMLLKQLSTVCKNQNSSKTEKTFKKLNQIKIFNIMIIVYETFIHLEVVTMKFSTHVKINILE